MGRTWTIAETTNVLERRWKRLLTATGRALLFKNSPTGRKVDDVITNTLPNLVGSRVSINKVPNGTAVPAITPYAFRSFDRQWLLADARMIDRPSPTLWRSHGPNQIYLTSLLTGILGDGPATTATELLPDLHHFRGSYGGTDVMPLFRDAAATKPNITAGILPILGSAYGYPVAPIDLLAYTYGLLASPTYVEQFWLELETPGPRLPLTQDGDLFAAVVALGRELLWRHTAGNRAVPAGQTPGHTPPGRAKVLVGTSSDSAHYPETYEYDADTQMLYIGTTGCFGPIPETLWNFEVSGLQVIDSWLGYRMKKRSGKASSELDTIRPDSWTFDLELIHLLWTLEATMDRLPRAADLLTQVLVKPLFVAADLPVPTIAERTGPGNVITAGLFDSLEE